MHRIFLNSNNILYATCTSVLQFDDSGFLMMVLTALSCVKLSNALVYVFLGVFIITLYGLFTHRKRIPGPFALPIIGNALTFIRMKQRSHIELLKLREKYGDVFRLYLGPFQLIVISGYENIYEAFVKHGLVFSHRPNWLSDIKTRAEKYGYGKLYI